MKFFHLSDLHIGLRLLDRDMAEDQEYILQEIVRLAEEYHPDAVVIAGDIYDRAVPSADAVRMFDRFVSGLVCACPDAEIMMISGNHDSGSRVNVFRSVLQHQHIHMIGLPPENAEDHIEKVTLSDAFGQVHFYLLPFVKPSMVKQIVSQEEEEGTLSYDESLRRLLGREEIKTEERNILVSHQFYVPVGTDPAQMERMDSELCTVGNIDAVRADLLQDFDYAALGHIHKPMKAGKDVYRYCGTPMACSFSEAGQKKGVLLVTLEEKGCVQIETLPLIPLRQVRILKGTLQEILDLSCGDYVRVELTDKEDLDVIDMKDRLYYAFPNLLEIRRQTSGKVDYTAEMDASEEMDEFSICRYFLSDLDEEEEALLREIVNVTREGAV